MLASTNSVNKPQTNDHRPPPFIESDGGPVGPHNSSPIDGAVVWRKSRRGLTSAALPRRGVITLVRLRTLHSHVSTLRRATWLVAGALLDCTELLGDAAEPVSRTVEELERLESLEGSEAEWRIANSLTWMSAAMADGETCSDYVQNTAEAGGSSVIADVDRQVGSLKEYTDNALALVDGR
ncbi:hypothetical protein GW17_00047733 [Ensete ventricosum]|nr:hypothetical protein GW17_00047733 [Ensete ventricosum]